MKSDKMSVLKWLKIGFLKMAIIAILKLSPPLRMSKTERRGCATHDPRACAHNCRVTNQTRQSLNDPPFANVRDFLLVERWNVGNRNARIDRAGFVFARPLRVRSRARLVINAPDTEKRERMNGRHVPPKRLAYRDLHALQFDPFAAKPQVS